MKQDKRELKQIKRGYLDLDEIEEMGLSEKFQEFKEKQQSRRKLENKLINKLALKDLGASALGLGAAVGVGVFMPAASAIGGIALLVSGYKALSALSVSTYVRATTGSEFNKEYANQEVFLNSLSEEDKIEAKENYDNLMERLDNLDSPMSKALHDSEKFMNMNIKEKLEVFNRMDKYEAGELEIGPKPVREITKEELEAVNSSPTIEEAPKFEEAPRFEEGAKIAEEPEVISHSITAEDIEAVKDIKIEESPSFTEPQAVSVGFSDEEISRYENQNNFEEETPMKFSEKVVAGSNDYLKELEATKKEVAKEESSPVVEKEPEGLSNLGNNNPVMMKAAKANMDKAKLDFNDIKEAGLSDKFQAFHDKQCAKMESDTGMINEMSKSFKQATLGAGGVAATGFATLMVAPSSATTVISIAAAAVSFPLIIAGAGVLAVGAFAMIKKNDQKDIENDFMSEQKFFNSLSKEDQGIYNSKITEKLNKSIDDSKDPSNELQRTIKQSEEKFEQHKEDLSNKVDNKVENKFEQKEPSLGDFFEEIGNTILNPASALNKDSVLKSRNNNKLK